MRRFPVTFMLAFGLSTERTIWVSYLFGFPIDIQFSVEHLSAQTCFQNPANSGQKCSSSCRLTWFSLKLGPPGCNELTPPVSRLPRCFVLVISGMCELNPCHDWIDDPLCAPIYNWTEREKTGGSCQCLGSVWRHFVPREGGRSTWPPVNWSPQSTCPLGFLPTY